MKFELILNDSRRENLDIVVGKLPQIPNEIRESFCKFVSFVRTVNNESMENFSDKVFWETINLPFIKEVEESWVGEDLFPMTVISVTRPLEHVIVTEDEGGRKQKAVHFCHDWRTDGYSRCFWSCNKILASGGLICANDFGMHTIRINKLK